MNSAPLCGPIDATTFRNIAKVNAPAVVNIQTEVRQRGRDLTEYFGGGRRRPAAPLLRRRRSAAARATARPQPQPAAATGPDHGRGRHRLHHRQAGLILTNNHVIDGAETIRVSFEDDRAPRTSFAAKVVGHDSLTDTALLQLTEMPPQPLTAMKFGDSDQMQPGDWVMAIGNPFRLGHSVSVGVISALGRPFGGVPGASRTCSRPTRPSTRATPAARCSTSAARWSA